MAKKYLFVNGNSNSAVIRTIYNNNVQFDVHENGTITCNYPQVYVSSFTQVANKLVDDTHNINVAMYSFKKDTKGYYIGHEDGFTFNVGWINPNADDLVNANISLQLYRKNLISRDKLQRYNVIRIKNLYSQYDINNYIKYTIIPIAKVFSFLIVDEDMKYTPIWDDPHMRWDVNPVVVYISKYQFQFVNDYYRTSKFIEWVLTDDTPKATPKYSGIVTNIINGKNIYQYDKCLTGTKIIDNHLTINGWTLVPDGKYASKEIDKVNWYKPVKMPTTIEESLYDGKKWLRSICLPEHNDYTNKELLEIFKYSISTEDTVLECCYETTFRILGAIKYLKELGYIGDMYINIQPKNTELPDIIDPIAKQEVFDTRDTVIADLIQLGIDNIQIVDDGFYRNGIGYLYRYKSNTHYCVGMDNDGFITYTETLNGKQFPEYVFNEYGLIVITIK